MFLLNKHFLVLAVSIFLSAQLSAQTETDSLKTQSNPLYRPSLELGVGVLSYYGDVGKLNGISQRYQLNWGYNLTLSNPLSNSFDLNLFAFMGKIKANERLLNEDVNFESKIRMGGFSVSYNFNAFLPENRNVSPYLSVGFSTYEYSTKSDLRDSEGNLYNYWDDGSIRLLPQNDPSASEDTRHLTRDYVYETDLRQASGNQSAYNTRAFTIPIGAGAELKMTDAFTLRMGTEFHLGLSDNLDNISDNTEHSGGKKGNDHFMYTSLGVSYNLNSMKKEEPLPFDLDGNAVLLDYEDQDNDGVTDIVDLCPNTPEGIAVTEYGCPWDTDRDNVPDYLDLEVKSKKGAMVNLDGVTITDEEILAIYEGYMRGSSELNFDKSATYTADIKRNKVNMRSRNKGFRVVLTQSSNLTNEDFAKLLSIKDIKADETESGSLYYLGHFATLEEAMSNSVQLEGFEIEIQYNNFGEITSLLDQEVDVIVGDFENLEMDPNQVVFRVQIGAYRYRLSKNVFKEVPDLLVMEGNDGLTRYVAGSFSTIQLAAEHKVDLLLKGFEGAFVTAYKGGERITLKEAGATVNSVEDISSDKESGKIDKDLVTYSVQLEDFAGRVPAAVLSKFINLGGVRPVRGDNGTTKYVFGSFKTMSEAQSSLAEMKSKGFDKALIVGDFNGQIIDEAEATKIKND